MATAARSYRDEHVPNSPFAERLADFTPLLKADDTEATPALAVVPQSPKPATSVVLQKVLPPPASSAEKGKKVPEKTKVVAIPKLQPHTQANERPQMKAHLRPTRVDTQAPAPVEQSKNAWKGNIPVWDLFESDQSVLFMRIGELVQQREKPVFAFFFEEEKSLTGLAMSVTIQGESVVLEAISAVGKLGERFPQGFTLSVGELRGTVIVCDLERLSKVNEFRRVMDLLRSQLHSSLSRKFSEAMRKSGR